MQSTANPHIVHAAMIGVALLFSHNANGQVPNYGPVCCAMNDPMPGIAVTALPVVPSGSVEVFFTAPCSAPIDTIEFVWASFSNPMSCTVELLAIGPGGVPNSIASGTVTAQYPWTPVGMFQHPTLISGQPYALRFTVVLLWPGPLQYNLMWLGTNAAGSTLLPYVLNCAGNSACAGFPTSGSAPVMIRFRSPACAPGPLAQAVTSGSSCNTTWYSPFTIAADAPPVLGTTITITSSSPDLGPIAVFWSVGGVNQTTVGVFPCPIYLSISNLIFLDQLGFEPIFFQAANPTASVQWPLPIPNSPPLVGTTVTLQGVMLTSNGYPTGFSATPMTATNALTLFIGY